MMPELDIQAAKKRCEAATEAPWELKVDNERERYQILAPIGTIQTEEHGAERAWIGTSVYEHPDAEFIAHARTDLPAALEALVEARKEARRLRGVAARIGRDHLRVGLERDAAQRKLDGVRKWRELHGMECNGRSEMDVLDGILRERD